MIIGDETLDTLLMKSHLYTISEGDPPLENKVIYYNYYLNNIKNK